MYNPPRFKVEDRRAIETVINVHPLATLISVHEGRPLLSHIPLIVEGETLVGHMARANPHSRCLTGGQLTAVFHGPDAYVSPSWYEKNDVPTWNYAVVHARGRVRLIEDFDGIVGCLKKLSAVMEAREKAPWEFWLPPDLAKPERLVASIVGFTIENLEFDAKFKLNQNRSSRDQALVIEKLRESRTDDKSRGIAALMVAKNP